MKEKLYKIGFIVAVVLLVLAAGVILKLQWDAKQEREALAQKMVEMKQLQDGIVRSQSQYVDQESFDKFAKNLDLNLDVIQDDLDNFGAQIQGINEVVVGSRGQVSSGLPSSGTSPRPGDSDDLPTCPDGSVCPDPYGYLTNTQRRDLFEKFNNGTDVPIGNVSFEAWKEKPWSLHILPRKYKVSTVLGEDENGRHYVHNRFRIQAGDETYDIPVERSEFVEKRPEAQFRVDPHINLGATPGVTIETGSLSPDRPRARAEIQPTLTVSPFSYGHTKVNPEWTFLGVGIGYESQNVDLGIVVEPVSYNLGHQIPFVRNLYLGPTVGTDTHGRVFVGGGIRVGL